VLRAKIQESAMKSTCIADDSGVTKEQQGRFEDADAAVQSRRPVPQRPPVKKLYIQQQTKFATDQFTLKLERREERRNKTCWLV
jgi:hypothetical protein